MPCQKHSRLKGFQLIGIQRESKTRKVTLGENPVSAITRTPLPPTSNVSSHTHRAVRDVYMRHLATPVLAAPQLPALRRSLKATHGHQLASKPPHQTMKAKNERGLADLGDKVALRHEA